MWHVYRPLAFQSKIFIFNLALCITFDKIARPNGRHARAAWKRISGRFSIVAQKRTWARTRYAAKDTARKGSHKRRL